MKKHHYQKGNEKQKTGIISGSYFVCKKCGEEFMGHPFWREDFTKMAKKVNKEETIGKLQPYRKYKFATLNHKINEIISFLNQEK